MSGCLLQPLMERQMGQNPPRIARSLIPMKIWADNRLQNPCQRNFLRVYQKNHLQQD
jgi:hypothetical protein